MAKRNREGMVTDSAHPTLQPDIYVKVGYGSDRPCCDCGFPRTIYTFADQDYCRTCAERVQAVLNRLRGR